MCVCVCAVMSFIKSNLSKRLLYYKRHCSLETQFKETTFLFGCAICDYPAIALSTIFQSCRKSRDFSISLCCSLVYNGLSPSPWLMAKEKNEMEIKYETESKKKIKTKHFNQSKNKHRSVGFGKGSALWRLGIQRR